MTTENFCFKHWKWETSRTWMICMFFKILVFCVRLQKNVLSWCTKCMVLTPDVAILPVFWAAASRGISVKLSLHSPLTVRWFKFLKKLWLGFTLREHENGAWYLNINDSFQDYKRQALKIDYKIQLTLNTWW